MLDIVFILFLLYFACCLYHSFRVKQVHPLCCVHRYMFIVPFICRILRKSYHILLLWAIFTYNQLSLFSVDLSACSLNARIRTCFGWWCCNSVDQSLNNQYCDCLCINMRAMKNVIEKYEVQSTIWYLFCLDHDNIQFIVFVYCWHCIMITIVGIDINIPIHHDAITKVYCFNNCFFFSLS